MRLRRRVQEPPNSALHTTRDLVIAELVIGFGHARQSMRRKSPVGSKSERTGDLRKNLTREQLEWIGAVAIGWNELEILIDYAMSIGLGISAPLWLEVSTRINGIDGKLQLIRHLRIIFPELDSQMFDLIGATLDIVAQCKKYRDGVIHARVFNAPANIGELIQRRGKRKEVLLAVTALNGLYERLVVLRDEMIDIVMIVTELALYRRFHPSVSSADDEAQRRVEAEVQEYVSQLQAHQRYRQSLPPLPKISGVIPNS